MKTAQHKRHGDDYKTEEKMGVLKRTLWTRVDYLDLPEGKLKDRLGVLDNLLEELLPLAEEYDKENETIWGSRCMRCRYVLGCD